MDARLSPCALSAFTHTRTIVSLVRRWRWWHVCLVGHRTQRRQMPSTRTPLNLQQHSPSTIPSIPPPPSSGRRVVNSFPFHLFPYSSSYRNLPIPRYSSSSTLFSSLFRHFVPCLFDFPPYRSFPPRLGNESELEQLESLNLCSGKSEITNFEMKLIFDN